MSVWLDPKIKLSKFGVKVWKKKIKNVITIIIRYSRYKRLLKCYEFASLLGLKLRIRAQFVRAVDVVVILQDLIAYWVWKLTKFGP